MVGLLETATSGTLVVAAATFGVATVLAWRRRAVPAADVFAAVAGLTGLGALAIAAVIPFGGTGYLPFAVTTAVGLLVPVPWILFAFEYTGRTELVSPGSAAAIGALPATGVLMIAVVIGVELPADGNVSREMAVVVTVVGTIQSLALLYSGALVLLGAGLLLWAFYRYEHLDPIYGTVLGIVGLVPWLSAIVGAQAGRIDARALDVCVTVGMAVGATAALLAVTRLRLFATTPAAGNVGPSTVIEELDDAVVVTDTDGVVVEVNGAGRTAMGAASTSTVGADVATLLDVTLADLRETDTDPVELHSENGRRLFEPTVSELTDQHSHCLGYAVVLRDVTERTTRQQRLEVLNRVLRHNLRNDVNAIVGYSDLLADDPDEPEPLADAISEVAVELAGIGEKARRIERLMASAETGARSVPLAPLAENVIVDAAAEYPDADYERSVPDDVVVRGSGYLLEHALRNLVENAIEHNDEDIPWVEVRATFDANGTYPLEVSVVDNGPGIPNQERAAVIDGDETPLEHGSGLGLWVVRWAITHLGGRIDIEDRASGGTCVCLQLPQANRREVSTESTEAKTI